MADLIDYGVTNADQSYSFVRGEYEVEKFQNVNDNLKSESERAFGISVLNMPAMQFVMYGTILGIFLIGGRLIHEGQMHLPFPMCCQAF